MFHMISEMSQPNKIFCSNGVNYILSFGIFIFSYFFSTLSAQEYETDRIYLKNQKKINCLIMIQKRIDVLKKTLEINIEHIQFLNRDIWNRVKKGIPLSQSQKIRSKQLLKGNFGTKYPSKLENDLKKRRAIQSLKRGCRIQDSD